MWWSRASVAVALNVVAAIVSAQTPAPVERLTFDEAIRRAIEKNPSTATAVAGILRAEGLLRQARAATLLQITGNATTTTVNRSVEFDNVVVAPRNSVTASITADMPVVAAAAWARRAQAADTRDIAELSAVDARQRVALATADAYLSIVGARRVVETSARARDVDKAHFDVATELEQAGRGSHVNTLRAQQQWSTDERLLESTRLALYRAQEALGVLIVADGPVDATGEPVFAVPPDATPSTIAQTRPDLRLFAAEQSAAERIVRDTSREYLPSLDALFIPQTTYPSPFFVPANSWRVLFQLNVPLVDSGYRAGLRVERQAAVDTARATLAGATTQAGAQVRAAQEAIASGERALASARAAADEAQQVVSILNISFRAGAATSLEVIDADRSARDADFSVAVAEDTLRRARLELLTALGRFP